MTSISFQTFGCKLNFSETTSISKQLKERGYTIVDHFKDADIHIVHSCTVTENAEKKCRQAIRHVVKINPKIKIIVIGCYSQLRPNELTDLPNVIHVCGNETKFELPELIDKIVEESKNIDNEKDANTEHFNYHSSVSDDTRTRLFLKIQDGCDYFCTYCAVPYARGRSRSDSIENVVKLATEAVESGKKEIVLSGVNIGDFGRKNGESFYDLLVALIKIEKLQRIRISSIEPNLLETRIIKLCNTTNKIMPHFHIPLQAGSDRVLKMMKRRYNTAFFRSKVEEIKRQMPLACIAIDLITGFPGETKEDFEDTIQFLDSIEVSYLHIFSYSDRPDAVAYHFGNKVDNEEIIRRSKVLHEFSDKKWQEFLELNKGTSHEVLFERKDSEGKWIGWTDNYIEVSHESDDDLHNKILEVRV